MNADYAAAIKQYFQMWVTGDFTKIDAILAEDCVYEECDGATYQNLTAIKAWIAHKTTTQTVQSWTPHDWFVDAHVAIVTWTFAAREGKPYCFDGTSIIEFNRHGLIRRVREFAAKHDRYYPFDSRN